MKGIQQPRLERLLLLDTLQRLIRIAATLAKIEKEVIDNILIIIAEMVVVRFVTFVQRMLQPVVQQVVHRLVIAL